MLKSGATPPRAKGAVRLSAKRLGNQSVLDEFRQSGSFKCLFPRPAERGLDAALLNTAGGITGGDTFRFHGYAATGTTLSLTTQACERAYKAQPGPYGQVTNHLTVDTGARLNWLPQETILFNGSALERRLLIEMEPDASALMVEPLVFGRAAMGETLTDIRLRDRIEIRRGGQPVFLDAMQFTGDLHAHLAKAHIANGAGAMALVVFASATAEGQLEPVRRMLPGSAGATLIQSDLLVIRMLAENSFALRRALIPVLRHLNNDTLPRCWMI
ncbi:urease accessory protein UreD [Ruegeria arenilitoris]|uniref:urease accessory protein UreD n=1 Tax=Ruegeria arenilitoris TaxID=1173585 RepID=UPI00147A92B2|nr:urease accessory protein UreD [Ruegeria arenilitoris]